MAAISSAVHPKYPVDLWWMHRAPVFKGNMFQEERQMPMKKKAKKKKH
jgi:hypothetical protein